MLLQEVKIKVVTSGDHCFVRMLTKEAGGSALMQDCIHVHEHCRARSWQPGSLG